MKKKSSKFIFGGVILGLLVLGGLLAVALLGSTGSHSNATPKTNTSATPFFPAKPTLSVNPTSGAQTFVRLSQYSSQLSNDSTGSIVVSVNLTVVPGQDLSSDKLIFSLLLNGSTVPLSPQLPTPVPSVTSQPTPPPSSPPVPSLLPVAIPTNAATFDPTSLVAQSFSLSFAVPASSNSAVFTVTLASTNVELFRQSLTWMNKSP